MRASKATNNVSAIETKNQISKLFKQSIPSSEAWSKRIGLVTEIHVPLCSRTTRWELVREFMVFIGPCAVWCGAQFSILWCWYDVVRGSLTWRVFNWENFFFGLCYIDIDTHSSFETIDNITSEKSDNIISLLLSLYSSKIFYDFECSVSKLWTELRIQIKNEQ